MKKIKIFLGSSIDQFKNERMDIENFIYRLSNKLEESREVKIIPLLCESFDDSVSKERKQEEYNEKVRESDFCFFIFLSKAGDFTKEEFDVAKKKCMETGKPQRYVYFKELGDKEAEESLYNFIKELDEANESYSTFKHIDAVKLRILQKLKLCEIDSIDLTVENDILSVDSMKLLSLKNITEPEDIKIIKELSTKVIKCSIAE